MRDNSIRRRGTRTHLNNAPNTGQDEKRPSKGADPQGIGYERFALARVTLKGEEATCEDFFDPTIKMQTDAKTINRDSSIRSGDVLLLGNNGTQVNFDRAGKAGEWEHFLGFGAGPKLIGMPTPDFDLWRTFIDRCHHIDIIDDEVWGLGKWKHRSRLKEAEIVSRLKNIHSPNSRA